MKKLHATVVLGNGGSSCEGAVGSAVGCECFVLDLCAQKVSLLDELECKAHGYVPPKMTRGRKMLVCY